MRLGVTQALGLTDEAHGSGSARAEVRRRMRLGRATSRVEDAGEAFAFSG